MTKMQKITVYLSTGYYFDYEISSEQALQSVKDLFQYGAVYHKSDRKTVCYSPHQIVNATVEDVVDEAVGK